jgi:D-aspartate ligase
MKISNTDTPVVILSSKIGAITIMRSLGRYGVDLYSTDASASSPVFSSKYCKKKYVHEFDETKLEEYLEFVLNIGKEIGKKSLLIQTSDNMAVFIALYTEQLSEYFLFPKNDVEFIKRIMSKQGMYSIALENNIPTPVTLFPSNFDDVLDYCKDGKFPLMLKGIYGDKLQARTGIKMVVVNNSDELIENYKLLEDPEEPNLMLQEFIPGDDDQVFIFNGYFDENSECLAAFTGYKVRQYPIHVGAASLGECKWNQEVADLTIKFMKDIGYTGILDIGYRLDPRDGKYKVLDINPRVGQAFRIFVAENGMDVIRSQYMDLTNQRSDEAVVPDEGRRWIIEDYDIISSYHYFREGTLNFWDWVKSYKRCEEGAWFSWRDPMPFLVILGIFANKAIYWVFKKMGLKKS